MEGIAHAADIVHLVQGLLAGLNQLLAGPLHYPSMYQDMSKGRPTEVDYINGYLARLGREHDYVCRTQEFLTHGVHLAELAFRVHHEEQADQG